MSRRGSFDRPSQHAWHGGGRVSMTAGEAGGTDAAASGSLRNDSPGIRSTQQLRVDWSRFEQHTFFNSARVKTNVAFDKIVNGFPFDGSRLEMERFLDSLTGFEKHVLDRVPKNIGYLNFSASYLNVADFAGSNFPSLSRKNDGLGVLDPVNGSMTVEMHLSFRTGSNGNAVVFQKISGSDLGFTLFVSHSSSPLVKVSWLVSSGSAFVSASGEIARDSFTHIAAVFSRDDDVARAKLYLNGSSVVSSSRPATFGKLIMSPAIATIATGSRFTVNGDIHRTDELFSGSIDELRVFGYERTPEQIRRFARREIFSENGLLLRYTFNEPTGTIGPTTASSVNRVVLDSSGNSLHTSITGTFSFALRTTSSLVVPMTLERRDLSPVLFPSYKKTTDFNIELITSASQFDAENPNLITRLVPEHYFIEGQESHGLLELDGQLVEPYTGSSLPGSGELASGQLLGGLLYIWANSFDEAKLVLDSTTTLTTADYDEPNTVPDKFLGWLGKQNGIVLPKMFNNATRDEYTSGQNIGIDPGFTEKSLQTVKNDMLRRVLTNARDIIESKGTLHSIKAYLRAIGINPDETIRIRQLGGSSKREIILERETRALVLPMLSLSASQALLTSSFLSSSRLEIGKPNPRGSFVLRDKFPPHGMSENLNDGFFTSGSWTLETSFRFEPTASLSSVTQSIARLCVLGDGFASTFTTGVIMNVLAVTGTDPFMKMFMRPGTDASDPHVTLTLSGADVFGGDVWNMSVTRLRPDYVDSPVSSSIVFRCASMLPGHVQRVFITQSYFHEAPGGMSAFQSGSATMNASGTFIAIGSQSLSVGTTSVWRYLNNASAVPDTMARAVTFQGSVGHVRFWSRAFSDAEWLEHAMNQNSVAVDDPRLNFGFTRTLSGSFERLRLDANMSQEQTASDSTGVLHIIDMSQENMHMSASGLEPSVGIKKRFMNTSVLSPYFDEAASTERVRIRGVNNVQSITGSSYSRVGPAYSLSRYDEADDDPRMSIDLSITNALNRDIMNLFASSQFIDDAFGDVSATFSDEYNDFRVLQRIYFNRLTTQISIDDITNSFKWLGELIDSGVKQLIPRKSIYAGANIVIEPHILERARLPQRHLWSYIDETERDLAPEIINDNSGDAGT